MVSHSPVIQVVPTLQIQRTLYDIPRGMERFRAYLRTMIGDSDDIVLPLPAFNPMGRGHVADTLDALLTHDAESIAASAATEAATRLPPIEQPLRLAIVVSDDVAGQWTNRELIEADRLRQKNAVLTRGWLVATWWASESVEPAAIYAAVLAAAYRDFATLRLGAARTLNEMMTREGSALAFSRTTGPRLSSDEIEYSRDVIGPYLGASAVADFPTVFACLFGDTAAKRTGYKPLGLSDRAGCAVALADVESHARTPELTW